MSIGAQKASPQKSLRSKGRNWRPPCPCYRDWRCNRKEHQGEARAFLAVAEETLSDHSDETSASDAGEGFAFTCSTQEEAEHVSLVESKTAREVLGRGNDGICFKPEIPKILIDTGCSTASTVDSNIIATLQGSVGRKITRTKGRVKGLWGFMKSYSAGSVEFPFMFGGRE